MGRRQPVYVARWTKFLSNKDGIFGLAPQAAQPGDVVVAVIGCRYPITLRRCSEKRYRLVGPTICNGNMQCETILGPLPTDCEPVMIGSPSGHFLKPAYRDRKTEAIIVEDPRLGPLPRGWTKVSHDEEAYQPLYRHAETGEERTEYKDPRLELDYLEANGHVFEEFTLM